MASFGLKQEIVVDVCLHNSEGDIELIQALSAPAKSKDLSFDVFGAKLTLTDGFLYGRDVDGAESVPLGVAPRLVHSAIGPLVLSVKPFRRTGVITYPDEVLPDRYCANCARWDIELAQQKLKEKAYKFQNDVIYYPLEDFVKQLHEQSKADGGKGMSFDSLGVCAYHGLLCEGSDPAPKGCFQEKRHAEVQ